MMEEAGLDGQRMTQKKAELEELWTSNMVQESQNAGMLRYHGAIHSLHEKTQKDYDNKRAKYRELKAELI